MRLTISTLHDLAYDAGHNEGLALDDLDPETIETALSIDETACQVAPRDDEPAFDVDFAAA